ncbi:MAG: sortase [Actinomycetota bacterium]
MSAAQLEVVDPVPRTRRLDGPYALRLSGRALLIFAAAIAGYLAWVLFGTGIGSAHSQAVLREQFETANAAPHGVPARPIPGSAVARLVIPSMELDVMVVAGADPEDLAKGPGLYEASAMPWDGSGRVAIAGHRTTYGAPFWDLDHLQPGDELVLETIRGTFTYVVSRSEVVSPTAVRVLEPTTRPTLVLTTCNPRFSAAERLVVFAERVPPGQ